MTDKEKYLKQLGWRIKEIREENNLTVKELAKCLGLTQSTVSRYENGKMEPKQTTVQIMAKIFGINPLWLIGYDGASKYLEIDSRENKEPVLVPILGTMAAGLPLLAQENIEGYECASSNLRADFCLVVKGDNMINARILDGDIVFIRSQSDVESGEIAAVVIDDEVTLKRVYKANGTLILRPENPNYKDLIYSEKEKKNIRIVGKAISFNSEVR